MATFSLGTSIKVNQAIDIAGSYNSGINVYNWLVYTAPANGYALVHIQASSNGNSYMKIGGYTLPLAGYNGTYGSASAFYIGPGRQVYIYQTSNQNTFYLQMQGVEFKNSP